MTKKEQIHIRKILKQNPTTLGKKMERLHAIIEILRVHCPWDNVQTSTSILHLMIEEIYELVEAIEEKNNKEIEKELGDILLHILLQSKFYSEKKYFSFTNVVDTLVHKLIQRHPHVFENGSAKNIEEVLQNWEKIKKRTEKRTSILEGIPKHMPQLLRAYRTQQKASSVGMDWKHVEDVEKKIYEEIDELKRAKNSKEKTDEFGDLLFTLVNYSRFLKINPEDAMRGAVNKFSERFTMIEEMIAKNKKDWSDYSFEELEEMWNSVKKKKRKKR